MGGLLVTWIIQINNRFQNYKHIETLLSFDTLQSNFDDKIMNVDFVPINYKELVHHLEAMLEPPTRKYIYLDEEKKRS